MKFEDFLMERNVGHQKRLELEEEVEKLQEELDGEEKMHKALQFALRGPVLDHSSSFSSLLPIQVQVILTELAMVEEEVLWLEKKVEKLKTSLYEERKHTKELEIQQQQQRWGHQHQQPQRWRQRQQKYLARRARNQTELIDDELYSKSQNHEEFSMYKIRRERRTSLGSASEIHSMSSTNFYEECVERLKRYDRNQNHLDKEAKIEMPNELSEELIKCLIGIFLKMNQVSLLDSEHSVAAPKLTLSCINSKSFVPKTSFNSKAPAISFNDNASNLNPYGIVQDLDSNVKDISPYKNFIQITRSSVDIISPLSKCFPAMRKLSVLMHKLSNVDLTFLTYKQKLAFWINIYNACIMHAFLQHGLPSTQEKLLALMNKAALNVGGIVLNALAIEHFILRHPCESMHGPTDEKETLLRHAYGLGYPEPNVTFALCRGSWSSPALRVYTPDEVVNELGTAKVEYLEASVGVTSKKKILVPKLLQWHMRDFADDMDSLLEWIYSQLPHSGSLKRLMMECLNGETHSPITKMVEIQPYESEFRYLLSL